MVPRRIAYRVAGWTVPALFTVGLFLISVSAWAGVTGKISGQVLDKKTKEPMIGAAVMIENTTIGAKTDIDGKFTILAVPPGVHSVRAQLIGHTDVIVHNVTVKPDQTEQVNFEMEESAVELKPIEVIGKTEMIQMDQATTKRDVTAEKIKTMPVTTVGDILKTTAGVTVRNDRFHIRGGRSSELIYTVDGVSMTDPLGGRGPTQALNLSGTEIENISIVKGAWSPEYGGTSGLVNVSTKEGDRVITQGHVQWFTDNLGTAKLNKYSFNSQRFEFTLGGPEPLLTRRVLPALGLKGAEDRLSYFVSLDFDRSDTYTPLNDYTSPTTRAVYREFKFLGIVLPDRQENSGNALLKLTYRVHPDIRLTGSFKRSYERNQVWSDLTWAYRYVPNNVSWVEDRNDAYSLRMTHNLSPTTYYEVLLSKYVREYWQKPGDPTEAGGTMDPGDFIFTDSADSYQDVNGNGQYDKAEEWIDTYPDGQFNFGDIYYDANGDGEYTAPTSSTTLRDSLIYDFNSNGEYDYNCGEAFTDGNRNGSYDSGDLLTQDGNANGEYDPERDVDMYATTGDPNDSPEPYVDGDKSLGEPFEDVNHNGVWDSEIDGYPLGEPFTDLSYNGTYDGPSDEWLPGIPFRDLNGNESFDAGTVSPSGTWSTTDTDYNLGEPYYDRNGNGKRDAAEGFYDRGYDEDAVWHWRRPVTTTAKVDFVSQVRPEHEMKVGVTYSAFDLKFAEIVQPYVYYDTLVYGNDGGPWPTHGALRDFYHQTPKTGAFYVVDKMEYGQMVAQVGFRYEFFVQSTDAKTTDTLFADTAGVTDYRDKFAPRLAFSYPISDRAKVFFNYGHFYQLPQLHQMYRRSTQLYSVSGTIGNVNLDFVKTIKYEFGVQYMITPEYLLSVQGFYTDDFGRVSESEETGVRLEQSYYENSDYSRARGLELELEKRYGHYVSGSVTYNFSYAYGKSSAEALDYFENFYAQAGGRFRIQEFPLDWDERHKITLILDVRVPAGDHPKLFGLTIPDNFGFNVFWQFGSGFPYTPDRTHPGVSRTLVGGEEPMTNSERFPPHSNVDLRFNKDFKFGRMDYTFEIWVNNLFDTRDLSSLSVYTGRPEVGVNQDGVIYVGDQDPDPRNWTAGRQVRLGVGVNF